MKSWKRVAFCIIGVLPVLVRADEPTTNPSNSSTPPSVATPAPEVRPDRLRGFDGYGGRFGGPGRWFLGRPSAVEWEEISIFMKEHSPERLKAINNLPDGPRERLRMAVTRNYRNYKQIETKDPALAKLMVNRMELEDQVFKLVNQIKAEKGNESQVQADKQSLQQKIGELIDVNINEREVRIAKLQTTLEGEQKQLASDSKNRDQLVERRLRSFLGAHAADAAPQDQADAAKPTTQP
jgi:hypothetical protein